MNRERFHRYLSEPVTLGNDTVQDLGNLVKDYPWFTIGRLLFLKALHNTEHIQYPSQLQQGAIHIPDRKALYEMIHLTSVSQGDNLVAPKEELKKPEERTSESKTFGSKTVSEYIAEKKKEMEKEELAATKIAQLAKEAKEVKEEVRSQDEHEKKKTVEEILIRNLKEEKIELIDTPGEIQLEDVRKADLDIVKLDTEIKEEATQVNYTPDKIGSKQYEPETKLEAKDLLGKIGHPKKLSFSDWLSAIDEGKEVPQEIAEQPVDKTSIEVLIDKFITEEPKLSKPKKEFFNPVNMAKASVEDDEELVTETLARIYIKQGNYAKAMRIYDILALKFPEKSAYFAALIQEIKNRNLNS